MRSRSAAHLGSRTLVAWRALRPFARCGSAFLKKIILERVARASGACPVLVVQGRSTRATAGEMLPLRHTFDRDKHSDVGRDKATPFKVLLSAFGYSSAVASIVCFYFCVTSTFGEHSPLGNVILHWVACWFLLWSMPSPVVPEKAQEKSRGAAKLLRTAVSWLWQGQSPGERALSKIRSRVLKASVLQNVCACAALTIPPLYFTNRGRTCVVCAYSLILFFGFDWVSRLCNLCLPRGRSSLALATRGAKRPAEGVGARGTRIGHASGVRARVARGATRPARRVVAQGVGARDEARVLGRGSHATIGTHGAAVMSQFVHLAVLLVFAVVALHRVIPREVISRSRLSAATAVVLVVIGLLSDMARRRILTPKEPIFGRRAVANGAVRVLRGLRGVSRASALWVALLLTDHALDPYGRLAYPRSERHLLAGVVSGYGPRTGARVCAVYVTSFVDSPRRDSVMPSTCSAIEKGLGVKCTVLDGPSMLDFPEQYKHHTLTLLVASGLIDQNYLIKSKCKERDGECLVPGPRFDGRYNHIDNFLTHIYAFMKFTVDHALDDPLCTALVLEDDVTVASGFARSIEADLASLVPNSYDLISLEAPENICKHYFQDEGIGMTNVHRVSNAHRALGRFMWPGIYAGGYMVSATGASRLIRSLPGTSNIDTWFNALSFWGSLRVLVRCPELVMQGSLEKYGGAVVSLAAREGPKFDKGRWVETKAVKFHKQLEGAASANASVGRTINEWSNGFSNRFYAELQLMNDQFRSEKASATH